MQKLSLHSVRACGDGFFILTALVTLSAKEAMAKTSFRVANDLTKGDLYTVGMNLGKPSSIVNYYVADRIRDKKKLEFIILGMFDADKVCDFH